MAGAAALILSANPSWTPKQVHDKLIADAIPNKVTDAKTGSPNRLLHVPNGGTTPPPTGKTFENTTGYPVRDNATVEAPITVSGITGNAPRRSPSPSTSGTPSAVTCGSTSSPPTAASSGSRTTTPTTAPTTYAGPSP